MLKAAICRKCMEKIWRDGIHFGSIVDLTGLLDAGADVDSRDRFGQTGLMIAARTGSSAVVRLLIDRGASLDHTAKYGLSALMLAVLNGHTEIVRMLVEAGADRNIRGTGAPGFAGRTALDLATGRGNVEMISILRDGA